MSVSSISRVLLVDPSFAAVPIHDYLLACGFDVWTVGTRCNDALAVAYPERWIEADYSDVPAVRSLMQSHSIDAVVPGCTDVSMNTFVELACNGPYKYGLEADRILNKKDLFRQLCLDLDLPAPRTVSFDDLPGKGQFIGKPADSYSGQGITIFDASDPQEARLAREAALQHSPTSRAVCEEEFVAGPLFSYSAFLSDGCVDAAFVVREGSRYDRFAVDTSYAVDWDDDPRAAILKHAVEKIAAHLSLCDGLIHTQFIADGERIAILEITRRCPGDLYSMLIELSTGYPYAARYASHFVGQARPNSVPVRRYVLRHTIKQTGKDHFTGFDLDRHVNIRKIVPVRRNGERLDASRLERTGLLFTEEESEERLIRRFDALVGTAPA